jgi:integrase
MRKIIKPQLGTVRYNLKESKESLQQSRKESPISLWFSYGKRQRLRYSIGISVGYADWDFERQRVRRNRSLIINSAKVNRYLDKLQNELIHHYSELVLEGKDVNNGILRSILDRLTNRNIESEDIVNQNNFFVFAHEFVEEKRGSIEYVTLLIYKQSLKKLESFSNSKTSIDFTSFTRPVLNDFKRFLEVEQEFKLNTISKHFKSLKTIVLEGKRRGLIGDVDLRLFSIPTEEPTKIYLSENELRKMKDLDLSNDMTMQLARDIFLVGCYTGQRISDYNRLSGIDIVEKDGVHFFEILQKKSGVKVNCPITIELREIIARYNNQPPPKLSDQKINKYLKLIGRKLNMNEDILCHDTKGGVKRTYTRPKWEMLESHTARRSFCTNYYLKRMSIQDIMHISGHKTEKEFLKYIRITSDERTRHILDQGFFNM